LNLVALLALTTAQRVQTLASINAKNIVFGDVYRIVIRNILKTTSITNRNVPLTITAYPQEKKLCVLTTLKDYISRTQDIRKQDQLLLSYLSPHKAVTSQRMSKWLCEVLSLAGLDIQVSKGHSYRHASTSLAASKGVNVETIYKWVGWSSKSRLFAKYYNKPVQPNYNFGTTVLSGTAKSFSV